MKVTLIGSTQFHIPDRVRDTATEQRMCDAGARNIFDTSADALAEVAGRLCYDSFHHPNKNTASNQGYLANILDHRHYSVLEHASASFLVEGVSRSLLMELRTHRHSSFSARSTRYVDESESGYVVPPALVSLLEEYTVGEDFTVSQELEAVFNHATTVYEILNDFLVGKGMTRKEAREAAREVLPGMTKTEFVVTANHHAWREILGKRLAPGAAREVRNLSWEILRQLKILAPNIYQDFEAPA